jgi:hypothetical protein
VAVEQQLGRRGAADWSLPAEAGRREPRETAAVVLDEIAMTNSIYPPRPGSQVGGGFGFVRVWPVAACATEAFRVGAEVIEAMQSVDTNQAATRPAMPARPGRPRFGS